MISNLSGHGHYDKTVISDYDVSYLLLQQYQEFVPGVENVCNPGKRNYKLASMYVCAVCEKRSKKSYLFIGHC